MLRVHLYISGRVQGVFFRANTQDEARALGLTGWVRNLADGRVEVVAEGEEEKLKRLITWCRKGPPGARVQDVQVNWKGFIGEFQDFRIKYG